MRASKQAGPLVSLFAVDFLPPSGREAVTAESRRIISLKRSTEADGNLHLLETSCPGVFVIGDVRSGSVKHVAASVGDGTQVVATLDGFLAAQVAS
jgi:thioredoxin reductase